MLYRNLADEIEVASARRAFQLRQQASQQQEIDDDARRERDERKAAAEASSDEITATSEDDSTAADAGASEPNPTHHERQHRHEQHERQKMREQQEQQSHLRQHHQRPRIPRETDRRALLQTIATRDDLIRQMETALFSPDFLDELMKLQTMGLSKRAAALVSTARRREAVLELQMRALTSEVDAFRSREEEAEALNASLHEQLDDARAGSLLILSLFLALRLALLLALLLAILRLSDSHLSSPLLTPHSSSPSTADLDDALAELDSMRRGQQDAEASVRRQAHRTREANIHTANEINAELRAAAQREIALRHELQASHAAAATAASLQAKQAAEAIRSRDAVIQRYAAADAARAEEERRMASLRDDMRYVSDLAEHAISRKW